jgi:hypothetical protein
MGWHQTDTCHRTKICTGCGPDEHTGNPCQEEKQGTINHQDCKLAPTWDGKLPSYCLRIRTSNRRIPNKAKANAIPDAPTAATAARGNNRFFTLSDLAKEMKVHKQLNQEQLNLAQGWLPVNVP